MMRFWIAVSVVLVVGVALLLTADRGDTSPGRPDPAGGDRALPTRWQEVVVVGHTDGDTIRVRLAEDGAAGARGRRISVRLLEIDAPESKDPDRLVQCFAREASVALARLMPVGSVAWGLVDRDVLDRYGRTLLYLRTLHAGRQTFVNEWLAAQGFARAALYPPNDRYIDAIGAAARRARRHRRGLWGACG